MARTWLDGQEALASIFFCRATQQGLIRLLTTAEVLAGCGILPLTNCVAWAVVGSFMTDERITFVNDPAGVEEVWKALALRDTNSPKLWMDAWLAAFAMGSEFQMVTTYKAFSQFKELELRVLKAKIS